MATRDEVQLGDRIKDSISGFVGIMVAKCDWLNGCCRVTVQPETLKDGAVMDNSTFDVEQVELVNARNAVSRTPTGGPAIKPTRNADPV